MASPLPSLSVFPHELLVAILDRFAAVETLVAAGRASHELRSAFLEVVSARKRSCLAWQTPVTTSLPVQPCTAADCLAMSTDLDALVAGGE
eukprot:1848643-Prymnesium_polylepis.1